MTQAIETPTDSPEAPATARPTSANRYQLFEDGQGDYRIYEVARAELKLPPSTLIPIQEVPGFVDGGLAKKWLKNSGDLLKGKQVMIFKGIDVARIEAETVTKVTVRFKAKKAITGPAVAEAEGK